MPLTAFPDMANRPIAPPPKHLKTCNCTKCNEKNISYSNPELVREYTYSVLDELGQAYVAKGKDGQAYYRNTKTGDLSAALEQVAKEKPSKTEEEEWSEREMSACEWQMRHRHSIFKKRREKAYAALLKVTKMLEKELGVGPYRPVALELDQLLEQVKVVGTVEPRIIPPPTPPPPPPIDTAHTASAVARAVTASLIDGKYWLYGEDRSNTAWPSTPTHIFESLLSNRLFKELEDQLKTRELIAFHDKQIIAAVSVPTHKINDQYHRAS